MTEVFIPQAADWINAFEAGNQAGMTRRKTRAMADAGQRLMTGDYTGASSAMAPYDLGSALKVRQMGDEHASRGRKRDALKLSTTDPQAALAAAMEEDPEFYKELKGITDATKLQNAQQVGGIIRAIGYEDPDEWDDHIAANRGELEGLGVPSTEIDGFIKADVPTRKILMAKLLTRANMYDKFMEEQGKATAPDWKEQKNADGSTTWVDFNDRNNRQPPPSSPAPAQQTASSDVDSVWQAAIQQESGGRPGVLGPQTQYGQAQGLTQMLPATAQSMAQKLGVPWRPDLMTANTPEAAAYQERLGRAYFDEGLQKYGGDPRKALAYYHGGPDERIWGPKTRAHVEAVMARVKPRDTAPEALAGGAGQDQVQPYQVASVGQTPPPPSGGRRTRPGDAAPVKELVRPATAQEKAAYGIPPDVAARRKPDGSVEVVTGGSGSEKTTEGERTAGFLASRLADSLTNLTAIATKNPEVGKPSFWETAAGKLPKVGDGAANIVRDADRQQVIANQLDILDAALTLGTGAAYTREQLENYRSTYFPVLTDKEATLVAKRQKLISLLEAAKIKAGRSAPPQLDQAIAAAKAQFGPASPKPAAKPTAAAGPVRVSSPAEAMALKPGTVFITPDGRRKVR